MFETVLVSQGKDTINKEHRKLAKDVLCVLCQPLQSWPTLGDSKDYRPPGSSVRGDSPGKNTVVVTGLPFPAPGVLPNPGIEPVSLMSPALVGEFFTTSPKFFTTWEAPSKG